jgi:hypothetical protein
MEFGEWSRWARQSRRKKFATGNTTPRPKHIFTVSIISCLRAKKGALAFLVSAGATVVLRERTRSPEAVSCPSKEMLHEQSLAAAVATNNNASSCRAIFTIHTRIATPSVLSLLDTQQPTSALSYLSQSFTLRFGNILPPSMAFRRWCKLQLRTLRNALTRPRAAAEIILDPPASSTNNQSEARSRQAAGPKTSSTATPTSSVQTPSTATPNPTSSTATPKTAPAIPASSATTRNTVRATPASSAPTRNTVRATPASSAPTRNTVRATPASSAPTRNTMRATPSSSAPTRNTGASRRMHINSYNPDRHNYIKVAPPVASEHIWEFMKRFRSHRNGQNKA